MSLGATIPVRLLTQRPIESASGYRVWQVEEEQRTLDATKTALVLCDVWDAHTCRGAEERLALLVTRMQQIVPAMRERGALIVHAPSDTRDFQARYGATPARERVFDCPPARRRPTGRSTIRRCRSTRRTRCATPAPTSSTPIRGLRSGAARRPPASIP